MSMTRVLQVQAIAFALYGIGFFLIPDQINDAIFGWEGVETILARIIGASFIGIAWIEWRLAPGADLRPGVVWPFVAIPVLFLIAFLWERAGGTYTGPELWWWFNFAVTLFFALFVGGFAVAAGRR